MAAADIAIWRSLTLWHVKIRADYGLRVTNKPELWEFAISKMAEMHLTN